MSQSIRRALYVTFHVVFYIVVLLCLNKKKHVPIYFDTLYLSFYSVQMTTFDEFLRPINAQNLCALTLLNNLPTIVLAKIS